MENKINVAGISYFISEPTLIILDQIKTESGVDLALGMTDASSKAMLSDLKKIARVVALVVKENEDETFDEKRIKAREEYFYKNGKLSDFIKVMGFFSKVLNGSAPDSSAQHETQKPKSKMKLVKPD